MAQARPLDLERIKNYCKEAITAAKVADPSWTPSSESIFGLLEKIGKQVLVNQTYVDKLSFMDAEDIFGSQAIEETFIGLTMIQDYAGLDEMADNENKVYTAPIGQPYYSTTTGRKFIPTFTPYNDFERVALSEEEAANWMATIIMRLNQSHTVYRYSFKKRLVGLFCDKIIEANNAAIVSQIKKPETVDEALAFIKEVKNQVEVLTDNNYCSLSGSLVGAAPSLKLILKPGIVSVLEETYAGAFNPEKLGLGNNVDVIVVQDFGEQDNDQAYALLVDERGMKVHQGYNAVRSKDLVMADGVQTVKHFEDLGYISMYVGVHAFVNA